MLDDVLDPIEGEAEVVGEEGVPAEEEAVEIPMEDAPAEEAPVA